MNFSQRADKYLAASRTMRDNCERDRLKMAKIWSTNDVEKLLTEYRDRPCLMNSRIEEYRNRNVRDVALSSPLASIFETTEAEVMRKLHNLRSQYTSQKRRLRDVCSGSSGTTATTSKWQFFESLEFLSDSIEARCSLSNLVSTIHAYNIIFEFFIVVYIRYILYI